MYLKRLELQGFKSFAEKTILEFMPGITTVIGPNGSGKSNISDAIRWVLGEQSMKSLRGSKSEDVIFAGTQNRKSLGFAEASIVIDNSDGKLPIEYKEVTVTRKLFRSGETGYFINKTPCRLKDILELFMDTGIGKDGYSIIGQGKIDEILSNKSEDRRHIFEEAAGIVKYRTRKLESERKLEQSKLNLLRINDILLEIEGNLEPLKQQSEKAKQFLNLREELKNIEIGLFIHNINTYKEKLDKIVNDNQIFDDQNKQEEDKLQKFQQLKTELRQELDEITLQIESMQNISFESSNKIEKLNSEINVSNERIANNNENAIRFGKEIEDLKIRILELEEEKQQKLSKKTNLTQNKEKFQKELEEKESQLNKLTSKLSAKELEIEAKKQNIQENIDLKYEITTQINTQENNYENLSKREKVVKEEISTSISDLDSSRIKKTEILSQFNQIDQKRKFTQEALNKTNEKRQEVSKKEEEFNININNLSSEYRIKESKCKFLIETEKEKDGYIKSVKSLLLDCEKDNNLNKGVHGVLANIISTNKEYEIAIQMCLGQGLQNIVTDTEQDAKKLVEHLRKFNLGRASFLPISSVKGKKIDNVKNIKAEGVIGIASDLVKYDKKYEQIILSLLGRTLITKDMDVAIQLAKLNNYSFRIVTLQGDIISATGAISGGSVPNKITNILGRTKEIENLTQQIKELEIKIKQQEKLKQEFLENTKEEQELILSFEKDLQEIDITYATEKQKVVYIEENVVKAEIKLNKLREELNKIEEDKKFLKQDNETKGKQIIEIDNKIEELNSIINNFAQNNKDNQKYIDDLNFDITNLKISVSSFDESDSSLDEMVERIKLDIDNAKLSIENKNKKSEEIICDNEKLKQNIIEIEEQIEKIKTEVSRKRRKGR